MPTWYTKHYMGASPAAWTAAGGRRLARGPKCQQPCGEGWRSDEMPRGKNALHIATENESETAAVVLVRIFGHIISDTCYVAAASSHHSATQGVCQTYSICKDRGRKWALGPCRIQGLASQINSNGNFLHKPHTTTSCWSAFGAHLHLP